jgi:NADPH-dependent curcumin reductase CurA
LKPRNREVVLAARPAGPATVDCFAERASDIAEPADGEVLLRNVYLSCDPHLRQEMDNDRPLPRPISSRVVGLVERSRHADFLPGDVAWGQGRWELFSVCPGSSLTKVDPAIGPISHAISVRGMPGLTAYVAMTDVGRPAADETVLVSAAAGAVGSLAGQFAKMAGARVVGIVGSDAKADHVVRRLGFDGAVNYRAGGVLSEAVRAACPAGVDIYFDCVGGDALEAALAVSNLHARFVLCGMIASYDGQPAAGVRNLMQAVTSAVTMTGFRVSMHRHRLPWYATMAAGLLAAGRIRYAEDIRDGLAAAPAAFIGMLHGDNIGKRLVRVNEDPYLRNG